MPLCIPKWFRVLFSAVLLIGIFSFSFVTNSNFNEVIQALYQYTVQAHVPSDAHIPRKGETYQTIIWEGVSWLKNAQEKSGHFSYEYAPYEGSYTNNDEIVRQTGALLVLSEIYRRDVGDIYTLKNTVKQSIDYFKSLTVMSTFNGQSFRCVRDVFEGMERCQLGATSLALVGILGFIERNPAEKMLYTVLIEDYVSFIMSMKKPDEGFRTLYFLDADTQTLVETSTYNGEALFALARYSLYHEREDVKRVIDSTFVYITDESRLFDRALYMWAMSAFKDMYSLWKEEEYVSYTQKMTDARIIGMKDKRDRSDNYCVFTEGFANAYLLLELNRSESERSAYREEIDFWLYKNSMLQVTSEDRFHVWSEGYRLNIGEIKDPKRAIGGFLTGHNKPLQRIDYTQHCLSSYVQMLIDVDGGSFRVPMEYGV